MTKREKQMLSRLKSLGRPEASAGMAHFGIDTENAFGVAVPELRRLAKEIGPDHPLALAMWRSGVHDARLLASMIAAPADTDLALAGGSLGDGLSLVGPVRPVLLKSVPKNDICA